MSLTSYVSIALMLTIIGFEGWRRVTCQPIGLMSIASVVFILNYCVPPLFIAFVGGTGLETGPSGLRLYLFSLIEKVRLSERAYGDAMWMAALAYSMLILGYAVINKKVSERICPLSSGRIVSGTENARATIAIGLLLGAVSIVALFLYSVQFKAFGYRLQHDPNTSLYLSDPTGLLMMLNLGVYVRADLIPVSRGFLQIIILLGIPAVMFLVAMAIEARGWVRWALGVIAACVWVAVLARVYHAAGRMEFMTFILIFPLAALFTIRSRKATAIGITALLPITLFIGVLGKEFFQNPLKQMELMLDVVFLKGGQSILFLLNEFSFPYVISAHTLQIVPATVGYRYFIDLPLSMLYMLPSLGGVDHWPQMITHIHGKILPLMPVDLISFGYYSGGVAGVMLVYFALGTMMAVLDAWLRPGMGWLVQCLRVGWLMYLPFRIMYADPYTSMKSGFGLIVGTLIVLALVWRNNRREVIR